MCWTEGVGGVDLVGRSAGTCYVPDTFFFVKYFVQRKHEYDWTQISGAVAGRRGPNVIV